MPLFKVWSLEKKKCVITSSLEGLISSGRQKLGLRDGPLSVFLEDGTEVDEDDILQELSPGTILYLLNEDDEKPWEWKAVGVEAVDIVNLGETSQPVSDPVENVSCETETSSMNLHYIEQQLFQPWPNKFRIPEHKFSAELKTALTSGSLSWRTKSELLSHISREILRFTSKPTVAQRDEVAMELISLFPTLKSNIGGGHHGWAQKIYDKMCEEHKRNGGTRKRPAIKGGVKAVKLPRRGEINFNPSLNVDPGLTAASKQLLSDEALKPADSRDSNLIETNMMITFGDRRDLVLRKLLVAELREEYPILFTELGIKTDFKLMNGFEIEPRFLRRLNECAEKIREEAILLKSKKNTEVKEVIENHLESSVTALRLLPILLSDKDPSFLYKVYPFETDPEIVKASGPETPHVAVLGDCNENCLCYVIVEKDIVVYVYGFVKAIMLMFAVYYCCNMQYASEVARTLKFFQVYLLELRDSSKLPSKLLTFCSKMP